jgi:hypothetical protein
MAKTITLTKLMIQRVIIDVQSQNVLVEFTLADDAENFT